MRCRKERQLLLFETTYRKSKPKRLPRINEAQAAELIAKEWRTPDGAEISSPRAWEWGCLFIFHLTYERRPGLPAMRRKRPERPTAERLRRFIGLETDWVRA